MRWLSVIVVLGFAIGWASGDSVSYQRADTMIDVSWPNCSLPRPVIQDSGIVGVNGGLAFKENPCLSKEASWFKHVSVYVNTGYPGISYGRRYMNYPKLCSANDNKCLAYNYGYNAGRYDVNQVLLKGVVPDRWWLDVETENSWTTNPVNNRSSLTGMADAIASIAGNQHVGFYSYPGQWKTITANWHNGFDSWVATGSPQASDAIAACKTSFTGGKTRLGQYVSALDKNYICKS